MRVIGRFPFAEILAPCVESACEPFNLPVQRLQGVKLLRIVGQYPFLYRLVDAFHALKLSQGADCARGIGVAIVGADDKPALSGIFHDIRHIVIGLAGDIDVVFFENFFGKSFGRPP